MSGDAAFSPSPPASAGRPVPLFSGDYDRFSREDNPRRYDVSADGNEFVVLRSEKLPDIPRRVVVRTGGPAAARPSSAP